MGELAEFEREKKMIEESSAFIAAGALGGLTVETLQQNALILMNFIRYEHPALMTEATRFLIKEKEKRGIAGYNSLLEIEQSLLETDEDNENDSEEADRVDK